MVIENNGPVFVQHFSDRMIESISEDQSDQRVIRGACLQSALAVPLMRDGQLVAAIILVSCSVNRIYGFPDLHLAEEFARRAALSIENARLFFEARRAIKSREDVLAIVSHDLKNPVTTIGLVAQVLKRSEEFQRAQITELANKIERAVDRMLLLTSDLLDFSKIESGTFSVEPHAQKLQNIVLPVIEGMKSLAEAREQTIECEMQSDLPEVLADPHRVGQALSNLLSNAIKFTRRGGRIVVSAGQRDNTIVVSVSDEGPGIPQENLSKVFDRYWQARRRNAREWA
jgi:signal transduction histidine kinase